MLGLTGGTGAAGWPASALSHLEGSETGVRFDADVLQTVDPADGRPLLARYRLDRPLLARSRLDRPLALLEPVDPDGPRGLWRWAGLLPVRDPRHVVYLGEGATPLLAATRLGGHLGVRQLMVKAEGTNPTGSFKARGMAVAVSRAAELGATGLVAPSAGNAAGALAAYGAAAGLPVTVVVPADTPTANLDEAAACGATVIAVDGFITDCGAVARQVAGLTGAFDVATLKEPYRAEGKKTMGLELAEDLAQAAPSSGRSSLPPGRSVGPPLGDRRWRLPDVVVYPTGGGTGIVGMAKAWDELEELAAIGPARPRMVSVQAAGCAPIVSAFHDGADEAAPWPEPATRASGLRVPAGVGDRLVLRALRATGGTAVAVDEADLDRAQASAGRLGLGYVSPETAAAVAATGELAASGWIARDELVVLFDTGVGHKYPAPPGWPAPPVVPPDVDRDRLSALLGRQ